MQVIKDSESLLTFRDEAGMIDNDLIVKCGMPTIIDSHIVGFVYVAV